MEIYDKNESFLRPVHLSRGKTLLLCGVFLLLMAGATGAKMMMAASGADLSRAADFDHGISITAGQWSLAGDRTDFAILPDGKSKAYDFTVRNTGEVTVSARLELQANAAGQNVRVFVGGAEIPLGQAFRLDKGASAAVMLLVTAKASPLPSAGIGAGGSSTANIEPGDVRALFRFTQID